MMKGHGGVVFVTVGTTCFDDLVRAVDTPSIRAAFIKKGYNLLRIQHGRGAYVPKEIKDNYSSDFVVECFTFKPSLAEIMRSSDLVISHAGSGSIFEALQAQKALVVVVNEALMDNHQSELAEALEREGYLVCATPNTLGEVVLKLDPAKLVPYPSIDPTVVAKSLDRMLGFPDKEA